MEHTLTIACRMVACREERSDDAAWSFYLINDSACTLDRVALETVSSEWGDASHSAPGETTVSGLGAGANALLWRDDGEFRMAFSVLVGVRGQERRLSFEFPRVYRLGSLPSIDGLDRQGYAVAVRVELRVESPITAVQEALLAQLSAALSNARVTEFVYCTEWVGFLPDPLSQWVTVDGSDVSGSFPSGWSRSDIEALEAAGLVRKVGSWVDPKDEFDTATTYTIAPPRAP